MPQEFDETRGAEETQEAERDELLVADCGVNRDVDHAACEDAGVWEGGGGRDNLLVEL